MNSLLERLKQQNNLSGESMWQIYKDILDYYRSSLIIEDNLSGLESLINNQFQLIDIEHYIIQNKIVINQSILLNFETLITIYDLVIQEQFSCFSKLEKLRIIDKYHLRELLECIEQMKKECSKKDINITINIDHNQLTNGIRLLSNLGFINYDNQIIKKLQKK